MTATSSTCFLCNNNQPQRLQSKSKMVADDYQGKNSFEIGITELTNYLAHLVIRIPKNLFAQNTEMKVFAQHHSLAYI
jgi:hypothetical protein